MNWDDWYERLQEIAHKDFAFHDNYMWDGYHARERWREYYDESYSPREALRESRVDNVHKNVEQDRPSLEQLRDEVK